MIALTFDIDWAPDPIVEHVMDLVDSFGVPATLFCTDFRKDRSGHSSSLNQRFGTRHEIALHPDFQATEQYGEVWDGMVGLYPEAKGWRSHNGMSGWPIMRAGVERGLRYEVLSSVFEAYVPPSRTNRALPDCFTFMTAFFDSHMLHVPGYPWRAEALPHRHLLEDRNSIVILGFHPNIVYHDMRTADEYAARKPTYHLVDPDSGDRARAEPVGAKKLLTDLLRSFPAASFTTPYAYGRDVGFW